MRFTLLLLVAVCAALPACMTRDPNDGANVRQAVANEAPFVPASPLVGTAAFRATSPVVSPLNQTRQGFWNTSTP